METSAGPEFERWETPFERSDVQILEVRYIGSEASPLVVRVEADGVIYRVTAEGTSGFRVLDELGLIALGVIPGSSPEAAVASVKVRGHGWSQESDALFHAATRDGWSFLILSGWECVEILGHDPPAVEIEGTAPDTLLH